MALVGALPKFADDFVEFLHLLGVVLHDGLLHHFEVQVQIAACNFRGLQPKLIMKTSKKNGEK